MEWAATRVDSTPLRFRLPATQVGTLSLDTTELVKLKYDVPRCCALRNCLASARALPNLLCRRPTTYIALRAGMSERARPHPPSCFVDHNFHITKTPNSAIWGGVCTSPVKMTAQSRIASH